MTPPHTAGPWVVFGDEHSAIAVMPAGRRGDICILDGCMEPEARAANAHLIAAAPDLFEALRELDRLSLVTSSAVANADPDNLKIVVAAIHQARSALTRARGEG